MNILGIGEESCWGNSEMVKLSVIVPILAGEMPQSLRNQVSGRTDVEVIVVKGVRPVGRARNEGLDRAKGDYIAWVDGDDEVTEDWLDAILRALSTKPDAVIIGYRWKTAADAGLIKIWRGEDLLGDVLRQETIFGELWTKILRRELWDGVRFDDGARTLEDWEVIPHVLKNVKKIVRVERVLYYYYARPGSLTHQLSVDMQCEVLRRGLARIEVIQNLGLWKKYARETMEGIATVVYDCIEGLEFDNTAERGGMADQLKSEARAWLIRHLPCLLLGPAKLTYKVKWLLASVGLWRIIRWYYVRVQGRKF